MTEKYRSEEGLPEKGELLFFLYRRWSDTEGDVFIFEPVLIEKIYIHFISVDKKLPFYEGKQASIAKTAGNP